MFNVQSVHIIGKTIDTSKSPHSGLIAMGALGGFALIFGLFFYLIARQKKAMASMAQKNGWQALGTDDSILGNYVPAYLLNNSQSFSHKYQMAYKAQVQGQDVVFFRYDDDVRVHNMDNINTNFGGVSDRSANQIISYAIAGFEVPQTFAPLLILHHSRLSSFGLHPDLQKFNLEGDFSKHFDVYAPQGSAVETLSVLTPDVMAFLIDNGQRAHWNVQINGHVVSIEGDADLISPSKISGLLNYANALDNILKAKPLVNSGSSINTPVSGTNSQVITPDQPIS